MRYFITGAAGFIGSHLTEALLADGHEVTALDDLSTGRLENLAGVMLHPRLRLVLGTVLDAELVDDLCEGADRVFHLAAAVGAFVIRDQALESLYTNVHGTENVVEAAHRHGARLLVASTGDVYGKNAKIGLREDDDRVAGSPLESWGSHAGAAAIGESMVGAYVRERGLWAVIARLFNTAGPRQTGRYGMVLPRFVRQGLAGQPLTVFGTGDQVRSFCHVQDVIPALTALTETEHAGGLTVNLGGSGPVTISGLAQRVIAATGSRGGIVRSSYGEAYGIGYEDAQQRVPDCTLARRLVAFEPARTLDDIIAAVIEDQQAAPAFTR